MAVGFKAKHNAKPIPRRIPLAEKLLYFKIPPHPVRRLMLKGLLRNILLLSRMELNVKQSGIERRTFSYSYRKTRNDKVTKRVQELYLRNDIPCGILSCPKCSPIAEERKLEMLPPPANKDHSTTAPFNHAILVDGISLVKYIDVLDEKCFRNVIILQSAWQYVKKQSPPTYKRLVQLLNANRDRYFVFLNEFLAETYVDPALNRAPEKYQEACLQKAASFLQNHWADTGVKPIVACSSKLASIKIAKDGLFAITLERYVKGIEGCSKIADRLADLSTIDQQGKAVYPEHWTTDKLLDGLAKGTLKKGKFMVSPENYLEAFVCFNENEKWFVKGKLNMNRAIHGDTVVAILLPESLWSCPEKAIRLRDSEETQADGVVESEESELSQAEGTQVQEVDGPGSAKRPKKDPDLENKVPSARVVGIISHNWRNYCGVTLPQNFKGGRSFLFAPSERLMPRIRIETSHATELVGRKAIVKIDSWPADSFHPKGHYVRILGEEGVREIEDEVILIEHGINYGNEFSPSVMKCLPKLPWEPELPSYRLDLTHLDVCSIDPEGCTDIDDALHCRELEDGRYEVGVHIADVTHFVRPGTALDKEASERSTTVYLCANRIDMLPEVLSGNLCSLRQDELRYAFSVIWILNEDASVESATFHKSLIRSRASLTYQRAQEMIDNKENCNDAVTNGLRRLMSLSRNLKAKRKLKGALELSSSEIRFEMDQKTGTPTAVQEKKHLDTMSLVEEFMLLANISVAETILKKYPDCAILRRHPVPTRASFKPLITIAEECGFSLNVDTGKELAKSLDEVETKCLSNADGDAKSMGSRMLRMLATRCMTTAVYFAAGTVPHNQYLHYGLAATVYTHFTSPIRRYADICVHRLLAHLIEADDIHPTMLDRKRLIRLTDNMNRRHRNAQYAARASVLLNTFLMIKEHPEPEIPAIVIGIRTNGIQVMVPKYGLESVIFLTDKGKSFNTQEEMIEQLRKSNVQIFQQVKVSLNVLEVNHRRIIDVKLVEPAIEGFSVVTGCELDIPK